mmetsp:Transcript_65623/g.102437  ORF Transcript_65623/g.102437 Transcript_65623/m.102437 type:complete len:756 (-) Transcript_65623:53-2320(-)
MKAQGRDIDAVDKKPQQNKTLQKAKESEPFKAEDINPESRRCTDIPCCCLFLIVIGVLIGIHKGCFDKAYPFKISYPLDHAGNSCGVGDYAEYPKVYYPSKQMITGGPLAMDVYYSNPKNLWGVCTKECPDGGVTHDDRPGMCGENNKTCTWYSKYAPNLYLGQYCILGPSFLNRKPTSTGDICNTAQEEVDDVQDIAFQSLDDMQNSTQYYLDYLENEAKLGDNESQALLRKLRADTQLRVGDFKQAIQNTAANTTEKNIVQVCADRLGNQKNYMADALKEIINGMNILLTCIGICCVVGGLYLLVVCFFIKYIVWGSLFVCTVGFGVAGGLFWDQAIQVQDTGLLEEGFEEKVLAVLCWVSCFICLVVITLARKSFKLAIAISSSTASFLLKSLGMMLLPQLLAVVQIGLIIWWLIGLAGILSTAEVLPAADLTEEYNRYVITGELKGIIIYHCFVGFWLWGFLDGLQTVTTAITVSNWYYMPKVHGHKPTSHFGFVKGLRQALMYHTGSVAFGALFVAIIQTCRLVLEFYKKRIENWLPKNAAYYFICCCRCCLSCLDHWASFLTDIGYIMVGVTSRNFTKSAWDGFAVQARNPKRFIIFTGVMWTVNFVGRLFIVGFVLAWGALLLNKSLFPELSVHVHSPWPVLICIFIVGWIISGLIFGVFTTSGTALFYCFVVDEEANKTSGLDASDYAPGGMAELLNETRELAGGKGDDFDDAASYGSSERESRRNEDKEVRKTKRSKDGDADQIDF